MNYSLDAKSFKSAIDLYKTFALDIKSISKAFLVGAKADLEVKVDEKEVWSFAEKNDLKYLELSAMNNKGVENLFYQVMDRYYSK